MTGHSADVLSFAGVTRRYGSARAPLLALDDVTLSVPAGCLFGLIGHNGAGKSTLFKLALGLVPPSRGRVYVNGREVGGRGFRGARRRLGYLPENLVLYDNLSAAETLRFFARLKGVPAAECDPLLQRVGLGAAAGRPVREYSKGMRQRLGFAQALLGRPDLLLLDEPTTGLDPAATRDFYAELDALRSAGVTVVISSHILAELERRVDAVAILAGGRLRAHGTVRELRERSRLPLTLRLAAPPECLQSAEAALRDIAATAALEVSVSEPGYLRVRCPRARKMEVLRLLAAAGGTDLQIQEPSLEDVYLGLQEVGA